jgi:hypothetical protein
LPDRNSSTAILTESDWSSASAQVSVTQQKLDESLSPMGRVVKASYGIFEQRIDTVWNTIITVPPRDRTDIPDVPLSETIGNIDRIEIDGRTSRRRYFDRSGRLVNPTKVHDADGYVRQRLIKSFHGGPLVQKRYPRAWPEV